MSTPSAIATTGKVDGHRGSARFRPSVERGERHVPEARAKEPSGTMASADTSVGSLPARLETSHKPTSPRATTTFLLVPRLYAAGLHPDQCGSTFGSSTSEGGRHVVSDPGC